MSAVAKEKDAGSASPLTSSTFQFRDVSGVDLLSRTSGFFDWREARREAGYWPYGRAMDSAPRGTTVLHGAGTSMVNFASQDYLSLSSHPDVVAAVCEAAAEFGVHSAGSPALLGNTRLSLQLQAVLAEALAMPNVVLYPTGWAAGYGAIRGLVRGDDYVVMDALSHACLKEGALAATAKVSYFRHLDTQHVRFLLAQIRKRDRRNGVLVVTEGLFSMDADYPNLAAMQTACREHDATLLVDIAHDFGSMGPSGRGALELQGLLGGVDLVMGSFSKTFASNGGFVATNHAGAASYLNVFSPSHTFSNALSPLQCAAVLAACRIAFGSEGRVLRGALQRNIEYLRSRLQAAGLSVLGQASPIVPVLLGADAVARKTSSILPRLGILANLAEYPAVPPDAARLRLQVMARHSREEVDSACSHIASAVAEAQRDPHDV